MPRHFSEERADVILGLVRATGFGHLVVSGVNGPTSTPVPFVIDDDLTSLRAHLARPNPLWRSAPCRALMIVPVTDAYISPTWYASKAVDGKVVPTWNYEVVHLHGELVQHDDAEWVGQQIRDMTQRNEAPLPRPWAVDDAPSDYIATAQQRIVGIELRIDAIEAKRKLSQNRDEPDRAGVTAGLESTGGHAAAAIAAAMKHDP